MANSSSNPKLSTKSNKISLKWILIVPFVAQVVISVGLVSYLSYRSGNKAIENITNDLMGEIGDKIHTHLDSYLNTAQQINLQNKQVIESGIIDRTDFETLGKYFWQQIKQYNFTYINYGTEVKNFIGSGYYEGEMERGILTDGETNNTLYSYRVNEKGEKLPNPRIFKGENPNDSDWYWKAEKKKEPLWSPIYNWPDSSGEIAISASSSVYSPSGEFWGVVGIDLSLSHISSFLQSLKVGKNGEVFILEKSGLLVATSTEKQPYTIINNKAERMTMQQITHPLTKETIGVLTQQLDNFPKNTIQEKFLRGNELFIKVLPYQDSYGIDWVIVITIPESDFIAEIRQNQTNTIILCVLTIVISSSLGIITARWITKPILNISQVSETIVKGDSKYYQHQENPIQEINNLSHFFSLMSLQLQEALAQSENRYKQVVQQQTDFILRSHPDTTITFANEALCYALGLSLEQVIGKKWIEFANVEDIKATLEKIKEFTPENHSFITENRDQRKDGKIGWTQWINHGIFNENGELKEIQSVGRDITQQKNIEFALRESEARFQQIAKSSPSVIYIGGQKPDGSRFFEYMSTAIEEMLGITAEEVLSNPQCFFEMIHPDDIANLEQAIYEDINTQISTPYQWRMVTPSGVKWVQAHDRIEFRDNGDIVWIGVMLDITYQKELQNRFDEIAQNIPGVVYQYRLRPDGTSHFPYASEGIKTIYNVSPADVKDSADIVFDVLHPEDSQKVLDTILTSAESLTPWHCEYRVSFDEDKTIWVEGYATVKKEADGSILWHGYIMDITTRKNAQEELKQNEKQYRQILDSITDIVLVKNNKFQITWANKAFRDYCGMSAEELEGIIDAEFNNPDYTQEYIKADALVFQTKQPQYIPEEYVTRYDGKETLFSTIKSPIFDEKGEVILLVAVARDITERKQAEVALAQAKETAEKATKAKSQFLANMSHEIRTPMNGVLGMAELLSLSPLNPTQKEYITIIQQSAKTLLTIINDILDFSKIESGMLTLEKQPVNLEEIINSVCQLFAKQAENNNIKLYYILNQPIPLFLGDSSRLQQIFLNLVGNAIKFTHQGEIKIVVDILNHISDTELELIIKVEDTGIGINADKIKKLFKPFSQADNSISREYGGTGLGLAISKNLVELMAGNIWLESNNNIGGKPYDKWIKESDSIIGSRFYFTIKVTSFVNDLNLSNNENNQFINLVERETNEIRILLAEDNIINQKVTLLTLKKLGYTADVANNGVEVLELLKKKDYDVILMDMQMPYMDGVTATKKIRESNYHQPYIIALTANALECDRTLCLSSGMNDYITKPFKIEDLERILLNVIKN